MNEQASPIYAGDLSQSRSSSASWATYLKPTFLVLMLLSTWVPMLFFLWSSRLEGFMYGFGGMKTLLLFLGTAHVPATIFFYVDKDFSEIIRKHRARYIYFPIALTVATALVFGFGGTLIEAYILLFYWSWQAFHYGRQNNGIYSFLSIAKRGTKPDRAEKMVIDLGTWCGIIGTFKILGLGVAPAYLHGPIDSIYKFGAWAFVVVVLASIAVYIRNLKRTTPLLTAFYFTLVLFFLPVFISTNINIAFFSYAMAHGVQYILFMTVVSLNVDPENLSNRVQIGNAVKLFGFIVIIGLLFYRAEDLKTIELLTSSPTLLVFVDLIIGAVLGATMAHFVIDAGAWRLSRPMQRTYMGKRFGFILGKPAGASLSKPS